MAIKELYFLGAFEDAYPRDMFVEHITNMQHLRFETGVDVTLQDVDDALAEKYKDDEHALAAAREFIDGQTKMGVDVDRVVVAGGLTPTFLHFDLRLKKWVN